MSTKYRAAGAIVILLSVMIAWILLMQFDDNNTQHIVAQPIPEKVHVETFAIPTASVSINRDASEKSVSEKPLSQQDVSSALTIDASQQETTPEAFFVSKDNQQRVKAWVLQVASFKDKNNARKLQKVLLKDDHPAYVKAFTVQGELTFRVLIGPKLSHTRAQELSKKIVSKHKLRSLIMEYKPGFSE